MCTFVERQIGLSSTSKHTIEPNLWVERHADNLYGFALVRVRSVALAEDLVQDTFVAGLKAMKSFKGSSTEFTWLTSILRNKITDHYRKKSTTWEQLSSESAQNADSYFQDEQGIQGKWVEEKTPSPWNVDDASFDSDLFQSKLDHCVDKMPEKNRLIFSLKHFEDQSSNEICKELNISSSNYWVLMHRTKLMLRECLEKNWLKTL